MSRRLPYFLLAASFALTGFTGSVWADRSKKPAKPAEQTTESTPLLVPTADKLAHESSQSDKLQASTANRPKSGADHSALIRLPFQKDYTRVEYDVSKSGQAILEGDIVLGTVADVQALSDENEFFAAHAGEIHHAAGSRDAAALWPGGVVPYRISGEFKNSALDAIQTAVDTLNSQTTVRLIAYDKKAHKDFVDIVALDPSDPAGGTSSIGRQGGRQELALQPDLTDPSKVEHEFMHALSFHHEQTRADRDKYIDVKFDNIMNGESHNFTIYKGQFELTPYDKKSVMHYDGFSFAKSCVESQLKQGIACGICPDYAAYVANNKKCLPTIIDLATGKPFVKSRALSSDDIAAINALYPSNVSGTTLPPTGRERSLRTTIERVITRAGHGDSGICGKKVDYVVTIKAGAANAGGKAEYDFAANRFNTWQNDKPERSDDFRPTGWQLATPISGDTKFARVDVYVHDHDNGLCGGKDDIVDVNPTPDAYLRLLVDTENGDVSYLGQKSGKKGNASFPVGKRIGSIFDVSKKGFVTLSFNGLLDGKTDYDVEGEIQLKIEIL